MMTIHLCNSITNLKIADMTRIAFFSQKELLSDSLALMLNIEEDMEVSYTTSDYKDLLHQSKKSEFDISLFIDSLDTTKGLREISQYCCAHPKTKVLILSSMDNRAQVRETYLVGAAGYVSTRTPRLELISAIKTVANGQQYFGKEAVKALMESGSHAAPSIQQIIQLTNREKEVVLLILEEKSSAEIAALLNISKGTVESHRHNIKKKLKVRSSIGVVKYAIRTGLAA